ncbi:hypothetical protein KY331_02410 [Candidatus Woesearchaeota archaeon]|nr:hypothetical protein [Candidatus Woesearchaeota archaeon]
MEEEKKPEGAEESKTEKQSSKMLYIILAVIILGFIVLFSIRFIIGPEEKAVTIDELHQRNLKGEESDINYMYNGFSFVYVNGMWYTQVQKGDTVWDVPLHFGPKQLENISIAGSIDNDFGKQDVYITFDPVGGDLQYVALASAELSLSLTKGFGIYPIAACDKNETNACKERPIKTCEDEDDIIYIRKANESKAELKENCVVVEGNGWEIVKATDRLLLKWYKIMD